MNRLHLLACTAALILALAGARPSAAETVYLRDGRKLVGKVTREGQKVKVEMALGTVLIDAAEVIYIGKAGTPTQPTAVVPRPEPAEQTSPICPSVRWNQGQVTLPEPVVFMLARRVELLPPGMVTEGTRRELAQWRAMAHDRKRKCGALWLSRDDQRRRRAVFEQKLRQAADKVRQANRIYGRTRADRRRKRKLQAEALELLRAAAKVWPDSLIGEFLLACVELRAGEYQKAELHFRRCAQAAPLVAAFHQGRGLALSGLKRPLRALEEFAISLRLRDETYQTLKALQDAIAQVPGTSLNHPACRRARDLLNRYEQPPARYRTYSRGIPWLMPGKVWTSRNDSLPLPPYDRLVARQTIGVPVGPCTLLVDATATSGAELAYVQLSPEALLPARASRASSYRPAKGKLPLPLTTFTVPGARFKPVDLAKPAALKVGQRLIVRAANSYRQMGTGIRTGEVKVLSVGPDGVQLSGGLLPGEAMGVAFAGQTFAGLLTARDDPQAPGGGSSVFVSPTVLAEWAARAKRSFARRSSYGYSRGPRLKADAIKASSDSPVFLVHLLFGERPPVSLTK
ncbi:MAG: hypothetical protein B1H04_01905 [Planctomycetales bacterium 4484_123]|nr:MAG: hypothetical protein B1H04_01905 [Planctomycetales bacterium 4484_123]